MHLCNRAKDMQNIAREMPDAFTDQLQNIANRMPDAFTDVSNDSKHI